MGSNNSTSRQYEEEKNAELKRKAFELYQQRVNNYKYEFNGPYDRYLIHIKAQYELDCLPNSVKYGQNYNK
jgi:hypothetical protein